MNYFQLPLEILPYVSRLSAVQLAIWADAYTWEAQGKKAYRTNGQLAELLNVTEKSISCAITNLRKSGFIDWSMINGRQRIIKAVIPSNVKHPVERKASRLTSIPSNVDTASRQTSTLHPVERKGCIPSNVYQVEKDNREEKREVSREVVFPKKEELVLPFESEEFRTIWSEWKEYKRKEHRFTFKAMKTEQAALHKLHNDVQGNERIAIEAIGNSIANGWKGIFISSEAKRELSRSSKPGRSEEDRRKFAEYIQTGKISS